MTFETSEGGAYAVLYSVLCLFTLLAIGTLPAVSKLIPAKARALCCLSEDVALSKDYFLSARNSASATAIGLSFFASGMGAWVLYGSPELGAIPSVSWLGVIGYSLSSAFPAVVISFIGPMVRNMTERSEAFSATDFARVRYGRVMQVVTAGVSIFYMFIYIVAEMTSIASVYGAMVGNFDRDYAQSITISLGVFTVFYTTLAGLPASIITDKFQAIIIAILVIMLLISVTSISENRVTAAEFNKASNWTVDGFVAAVSLAIALLSAELFNQSNWQRVWAAESVPAMRKGFFMGSVLVFFLMMFFGIMGMIAYAKDPVSYDEGLKATFLSFFDILEPLSNFWHVVVLILVTALASSSVDSLQNALTSIFSRDLVKLGWNPVLITRILLVGINIPAIIMSAKQYDVISLFLVADIVCATSVVPLFSGLQVVDWANGWIPAPTELGAFLGCLSGVITVIVNGYLNDINGSNPFEYFWLKNGGVCSLCGERTMVSFIITPIVSCFVTYLVSLMDIKCRGERARQPLFRLAFDEGDKDAVGIDADESGVNFDPENDEKRVVSKESGLSYDDGNVDQYE